MSRLTRELIRRVLEAEPGIQVVHEVTAATDRARELIEEAEADVIIVGNSAPDLLTDCRALLTKSALRRVIAVSTDGRDARLYGIRPYETAAEEFSPQFVVDAVRDADSRVEA
jgi:DNA-binding NarL/FixJ family response regulator